MISFICLKSSSALTWADPAQNLPSTQARSFPWSLPWSTGRSPHSPRLPAVRFTDSQRFQVLGLPTSLLSGGRAGAPTGTPLPRVQMWTVGPHPPPSFAAATPLHTHCLAIKPGGAHAGNGSKGPTALETGCRAEGLGRGPREGNVGPWPLGLVSLSGESQATVDQSRAF